MTRDDFGLEIMKRFPKLDPVMLDDVHDWLDDSKIRDSQLPIVLKLIKTKNEYSTFPPIAKIARWWSEQSGYAGHMPQGPSARSLDDWGRRSSKEIAEHMQLIRADQDRRRLTNAEIDFLVTWDTVGYFYASLLHMGWEERRVIAYVDKIRNAIINGEKVSYEAVGALELAHQTERTGRTDHISQVVPA